MPLDLDQFAAQFERFKALSNETTLDDKAHPPRIIARDQRNIHTPKRDIRQHRAPSPRRVGVPDCRIGAKT